MTTGKARQMFGLSRLVAVAVSFKGSRVHARCGDVPPAAHKPKKSLLLISFHYEVNEFVRCGISRLVQWSQVI